LLNLECGNSIEFDSFILNDQCERKDIISQVDSLKEYIALYRNNFYKRLWSYADQFLIKLVDENDEMLEMSGGEYIETYGKWELTYGKVVLKSDHLFGEFK